jgi:hypothetical protein
MFYDSGMSSLQGGVAQQTDFRRHFKNNSGISWCFLRTSPGCQTQPMTMIAGFSSHVSSVTITGDLYDTG